MNKHLKNNFIKAVIIGILVSGCRTDTENVEIIDYSKIRILDVELVQEIGADGGNVFGRLRDLVVFSGGTLVVSDLGKGTIEQFTEEGEWIGTIAKRGGGPGELSSFFLLYNGESDTLNVLHRRTQQMDFFSRSDGGIFEHVRSVIQEHYSDRYVTLLGAISDSEFLATAEWTSSDFQTFVRNYSDSNLTPVVTTDNNENILQDSLHLLKTPNALVEFGTQSGTVRPIGMPPFQYHDRLRIMEDDRYMIARSESTAFYIYNMAHKLDTSITLHVKERQVEKKDLDYELRNVSKEYRSQMEARIPDSKPSFLNIWLSEDHILMQTDTGEKGIELVLLTMEGKPSGKFLLSEHDNIRYFRENRIYTFYENPETGNRIRIYQIELEKI